MQRILDTKGTLLEDSNNSGRRFNYKGKYSKKRGGKQTKVLRTKEIRLPSKDLIKTVAEKSNNKTLLAMLDDKSAMADYLYGREVADVLQDCTTDFKACDFAALLKPLAHRLYSISSSPNAQTWKLAPCGKICSKRFIALRFHPSHMRGHSTATITLSLNSRRSG